MELLQKKFTTKHKFIFEEDTFNFSFNDSNGSADINVKYADFPNKNSVSIEHSHWFRNVGYAWVAIGALQLGGAIYTNSPLSGKAFWLILGIGCLAWYFISRIKHSVFKTEAGNVFIMQDSQHNKIIKEIRERRKKQLLDWYGNIDIDNELENEISKFNWLVKEEVLTEKEAEEKINHIKLQKLTSSELLADSNSVN
jgi:hypothetical protein